MAQAKKHTNDRDEVKWQPMLDDGDRCWVNSWGKVWSHYAETVWGTYGPKLYKSKARALRVAKRREHREAGWFREAPDA